MIKTTPPEFIEITLYPQGRVDLVEFSNALLALTAEYRDWLRQHPKLDHKDPDLRLYIEKLNEGSIEIWLTQANDLLIYAPLADFCKEYLQEFIGALLLGAVAVASRKRVANTTKFLKWEFKWKYKSPSTEFGIDSKISAGQLETGQANLAELRADSDTERVNKEIIRFKGFHTDGNARTIASRYADTEVKTFLKDQVREIFMNVDENIFKEGKEFLVDMDVIRRQGEIEAYFILEVHGV